MTFADLVLAVHGCLSEAGVGHAFGGALALAYITEPRGTVDIDVNVFARLDDVGPVLASLARLGLAPELAPERWVPVAGIRVRGGADPYPVDLFPSLDDRYAEVERRTILRPFGADQVELPFLGAEDLTLFKLSFGRDKDWVDLRAIAVARPDLDMDYVERQLIGLRGPTTYPRLARMRRLLAEAPGS